MRNGRRVWESVGYHFSKFSETFTEVPDQISKLQRDLGKYE